MDEQAKNSVVRSTVAWAVGLSLIAIAVLLLLVVGVMPHHSEIKGKLTTSQGPIADGAYDFQVRTYSLLDSTQPLDTQTVSGVQVKGGTYGFTYHPTSTSDSADTIVEVCLQLNDADKKVVGGTDAACQNVQANAAVCPYYVPAHTGTRVAWLMGANEVNNQHQLHCQDGDVTVVKRSAVETATDAGVSPLLLFALQRNTSAAEQKPTPAAPAPPAANPPAAPTTQQVNTYITQVVGGSSQPDTNTTYSAGNGLLLIGTTFSRVPGTANGQMEFWNGGAWQTLQAGANGQFLMIANGLPQWVGAGATGDVMVGNEVVGGTGSNSGLSVSGAGTNIDPLTMAINTGAGLAIGANVLQVTSPMCSAPTQKLGWSGTAFVCGTDANTTYSAGTGLSLAGTTFNNAGVLSVGTEGLLAASGGQNPTISCPLCLGVGSSLFTIDSTNSIGGALTVKAGDSVLFAAGQNITTTNSGTGTIVIGTVDDPTFTGPVTAGGVITNLLAPASGTLLISGNLSINGALQPGGFAGSTGQLLVSQGSGVPPQWQTFDFNAIADARITLQKSVANGLATLGPDAKIPNSQLPALAITDTFVRPLLDNPGGSDDSCTETVATIGDVCVVTSASKSYILASNDKSVASDWVELLTPGSAVSSVNGQTGNVVLTASNGLSVAGNTDFRLGGTLTSATTINQAGNHLMLTGASNLGVGTASPTQKLDVVGNVQFTGGLMPGGNSGTNGQVLVSQGAGAAPVWQDPGIAVGDSVIGNEVQNVTGSNSGLTRSGTGTAGNPYTLALNVGNGLTIASNQVAVNSPVCSALQKLSWSGAAFACASDAASSLNGLTAATQTFATGTAGVDFNISSSGSTHTFNIPDASSAARGLMTTGAQTFAGQKTFQDTSDSASAFRVLTGAGVPLFSIDTVASRVYIGDLAADATGGVARPRQQKHSW